MRALRSAAEEDLVGRARAGDREAFGEIARRNRPQMLATARRVLGGSAHEAEDVVQDALMLALRALERDDRPLILRPWLAMIARNRAIDLVRRPVREARELHPNLRDPHGDVIDLVARRDLLALTVRRLSDLPERQRAALVGQAFEGATARELAERLGTTTQAVKALVHRARTDLAEAA